MPHRGTTIPHSGVALWRLPPPEPEILKSRFCREGGCQSQGGMGVFRRLPSGGNIDSSGRLVGATAPGRGIFVTCNENYFTSKKLCNAASCSSGETVAQISPTIRLFSASNSRSSTSACEQL